MNNFFLLLFITTLLACNATKIMDNPTKMTLRKYVTEYNGFNKNECDKGCIAYDEAFYKWVFNTKKHGLWITKHAISTWLDQAQPNCLVLYIRHPKDMTKLYISMRNIFEDEFTCFIEGYSKCPGVNACELYVKNENNLIFPLKKNELDTFLINHSNIKVLDY